ncbi:nuclear transport factor 2 family protein [Yinghuangia soli]|uniref:Nuclear transport factor 2 family protein n=1 Tax=Yinghuangia soli TaxID=2908204 RepID=A0AA41PU59_9ACTN|nr:nuclear transport factor 2 family protein [Yinghuangia soli]MCF2525761.1 nuclear transport factor 2 family protein [Yinghuangia soli]
MGTATGAEPGYIADRLALRDLVETYAQGADRRRPEQVASLFLPEGRLVVERDPGAEPIVRTGPAQIAKAMTGLDRYIATMHVVANQLVAIDGDRAEAETYCTAHHIYDDESGVRRDRVMAVRYEDVYVRTPDGWRIETRRLNCDWVEDRPLTIAS